MTWQDLIDDIRLRLNDPSKNRWTDGEILDRINITRNELYGIHPEAFYVSSVVTSMPTDPNDSQLESTIDIMSIWVGAVMNHVLWQCYMDDSDATANGKLADTYFAVWAKKVGV
jgi:hypothetical protein